jgi:hypothetical protein
MTGLLDPFRFVLIALSGWMNGRQPLLIDYLREENRVLPPHGPVQALLAHTVLTSDVRILGAPKSCHVVGFGPRRL